MSIHINDLREVHVNYTTTLSRLSILHELIIHNQSQILKNIQVAVLVVCHGIRTLHNSGIYEKMYVSIICHRIRIKAHTSQSIHFTQVILLLSRCHFNISIINS